MDHCFLFFNDDDVDIIIVVVLICFVYVCCFDSFCLFYFVLNCNFSLFSARETLLHEAFPTKIVGFGRREFNKDGV